MLSSVECWRPVRDTSLLDRETWCKKLRKCGTLTYLSRIFQSCICTFCTVSFHWSNLNNYFNFHVRLSFRPSVLRPPSVRKLASIPAVVQQIVTNKRCLVCAMSEKYAFWVTLRPKSDPCRRGEAEVRILDFKTTWSEFQKASQTAIEPESVTSSCVRNHT